MSVLSFVTGVSGELVTIIREEREAEAAKPAGGDGAEAGQERPSGAEERPLGKNA